MPRCRDLSNSPGDNVRILRRLPITGIGSWQAVWGGVTLAKVLDHASSLQSGANRPLLVIVAGIAAAHVLCGVALMRERRYARPACIALQLAQVVQISAFGVLYEMFLAPRVSLLITPSVGLWFGASMEPSIVLRYGTSAPPALGVNMVALLLAIRLATLPSQGVGETRSS